MNNGNPWIQENLTPKQTEYVADTASGKSTFDIADARYVSQNTVRNTLTSAKERVGASSTTNLVAMAITKGWIEVIKEDEIPLEYVARR